LPCCAFAACIVAQILVAFGAVRQFLFGVGANSTQRNPAVEWRLEPASARRFDPSPSGLRRVFGSRPYRSLALAAALEIAIVLGAFYGFVEHARHGTQHVARVDETEVDHRRGTHHTAAVDPLASPSGSSVHSLHR
jgi:hypothetical protein